VGSADALRLFIADPDAAGVLVMCDGVVMNNNRRKLNPEELRGFAIADALTPLVFIDGADTKSAHRFTLAHELAPVLATSRRTRARPMSAQTTD
jgi:Zn-dependent peptidase ImmA (M78 family)